MSDLTTPEPVTPLLFARDLLDETAPQTQQEILDDAAGYYYAYGRIDGGHPPVAGLITDGHASEVPTVWLFGRMWMQSQREYRSAETGGYFPGIVSAWENFVATGGRSVRSPRA